jgi:hypothetical protein
VGGVRVFELQAFLEIHGPGIVSVSVDDLTDGIACVSIEYCMSKSMIRLSVEGTGDTPVESSDHMSTCASITRASCREYIFPDMTRVERW